MTHRRKEIREVIKTLLEGASIVPSGSVFANRRRAVEDDQLPVICIFVPEEDAEPADVTSSKSLRQLTVTIEATTSDVNEETIDDDLDDLAEEIETAMNGDPFLGNLASNTRLTGTQLSDDQRGDVVIGKALLTYQVEYVF